MFAIAAILIITMCVAAALGLYIKKGRAQVSIPATPFMHQVAAVLVAVAASFFASFVLHIGLLAVTGAQAELGAGTYSAPLLLVGGPLAFSGVSIFAGLLGAFLAIGCNEVLKFMRIDERRYKLVVFAVGIVQASMLYDSVTSDLQKNVPMIMHLMSGVIIFVMVFSTFIGVIAATSTLWILNRRRQTDIPAITEDQPVKELHIAPRTFVIGATVCGAIAILIYFGLAVSQGWAPAAAINLLAVLIQEQLLLAIPGFGLMFVYLSIRKRIRPALAMALAAIASGALLNLPPMVLEPFAFWVDQHLHGVAAWSASVATAALTATWLISVVSLPVIIGFYRKSKRIGKIAVNCAIAVTICPFWLVAMNQALLEDRESSECEAAA